MNHRPLFSHRQRPPWWPENEEWPPKRLRHMRGRPFFRRMGCLFILFTFFAFSGFVALLRFILAPFIGFPNQPHISGTEWLFLLAMVAGFLVLLGGVYWGVRGLRRMSMPLDDLLDASNRVADGDYSARVDLKGTPEIRTLIHGFNAMAERLQENDRQRRAMLADVAHELRTPITVIQGNVEGILDGLYPADEARLKSIMEETQILARLVDDLRTLSLAESGSLQLRREPTDLNELIQDVVAGYESKSREKGIRFELPLKGVAEVNVDPQRVREVLSNLIGNALHYAPSQGVVKVGLAESGSGPEKEALIFVEDNGPGIQTADMPHVFERFYKSNDSGGMGLGLSIAKYLIEAHGGRIWAESGAEKGIRISLTIPA
jgi:signal transduction histidine kinase